MGNGTSIGKVRGLGPSHSGTHHWLLQRFTAVGNLVLGLFLLFALLTQPDFLHATIVAWAAKPIPALALALFVVSTFWHARLGLQVLVEDYVHEPANKFACIVLLNLAAFGGAAAGLIFIARIVMLGLGADAAQDAIKAAMGGQQ